MELTNKILADSLKEVELSVNQTPFNAGDQRKLNKKGYSFSNIPLQTQVTIWDYIWKNGSVFWVKLQAFFYVEKLLTSKPTETLTKIWPVVNGWQATVNNWGL